MAFGTAVFIDEDSFFPKNVSSSTPINILVVVPRDNI